MNSIRNVLIFILCLMAISNALAQTIKKFSPKVSEKGSLKEQFSFDDEVEYVNLYKNIPKDFVDYKSSYLYIDLVQGAYEKLMLETQQPEKWQKFKKRFSIPDTIKIYEKKLMNNKLAVFYRLDENQNAKIIVDKNGNMDLSDDQIFTVSKTDMSKNGNLNLDIPVKLYNSYTNSTKDSVVAIEMILALKSETAKSVKDLILKFKTRKNLTAQINSKNFRYIFSWIPLLSPTRKYMASTLPIKVDIMDKNDNLLNSRYLIVGDTLVINNYRTIIKQYNGDQLIIQTDSKELAGYEVGQLFRPIYGIDIFNPDKKIEITSKSYLVLDFWGTWCAPCIASMPELVSLAKKYKGKADVISMVSDDKNNMELAKKIITEQKLSWPQIWDERKKSSITNTLQVQFFPTMIVMNKEKKIVFVTSNIESLDAFLEKVE